MKVERVFVFAFDLVGTILLIFLITGCGPVERFDSSLGPSKSKVKMPTVHKDDKQRMLRFFKCTWAPHQKATDCDEEFVRRWCPPIEHLYIDFEAKQARKGDKLRHLGLGKAILANIIGPLILLDYATMDPLVSAIADRFAEISISVLEELIEGDDEEMTNRTKDSADNTVRSILKLPDWCPIPKKANHLEQWMNDTQGELEKVIMDELKTNAKDAIMQGMDEYVRMHDLQEYTKNAAKDEVKTRAKDWVKDKATDVIKTGMKQVLGAPNPYLKTVTKFTNIVKGHLETGLKILDETSKLYLKAAKNERDSDWQKVFSTNKISMDLMSTIFDACKCKDGCEEVKVNCNGDAIVSARPGYSSPLRWLDPFLTEAPSECVDIWRPSPWNFDLQSCTTEYAYNYFRYMPWNWKRWCPAWAATAHFSYLGLWGACSCAKGWKVAAHPDGEYGYPPRWGRVQNRFRNTTKIVQKGTNIAQNVFKSVPEVQMRHEVVKGMGSSGSSAPGESSSSFQLSNSKGSLLTSSFSSMSLFEGSSASGQSVGQSSGLSGSSSGSSLSLAPQSHDFIWELCWWTVLPARRGECEKCTAFQRNPEMVNEDGTLNKDLLKHIEEFPDDVEEQNKRQWFLLWLCSIAAADLPCIVPTVCCLVACVGSCLVAKKKTGLGSAPPDSGPYE